MADKTTLYAGLNNPTGGFGKSSHLAPSNAGQFEYSSAAAAVVHRSQRYALRRSAGLQPEASHIDRIPHGVAVNTLSRSRWLCLTSVLGRPRDSSSSVSQALLELMHLEEMLARDTRVPRFSRSSINVFPELTCLLESQRDSSERPIQLE